MLKVTVDGNVGADPESKYTSAGKEVCQLRMAVNFNSTDKEGERTQHTEWMTVRTMNQYVITRMQEQVTKGTRLIVIGELKIGEYTHTQTGDIRKSFDIWADTIIPVNRTAQDQAERGRDEGERQGAERQGARAQSTYAPPASQATRPPTQAAGARLGSRAAQAAEDLDLADLPF